MTRFGRPLVTYEKGGGTLNVAPALSPDGRRVVFLSERSQFAIEMYMADMATGKVTQKLVKTGGDPHFESLEFIDSAGDWAPDGRQFVFAALTKGQPVLAVVDVDTGKRLAEHPFPNLDRNSSTRPGRPTAIASRSRRSRAACSTCSSTTWTRAAHAAHRRRVRRLRSRMVAERTRARLGDRSLLGQYRPRCSSAATGSG